MQYKFFRISVFGDDAIEEEMNRFLLGHSILTAKREFVADGQASFWAFVVEYLENGKLAAETFSRALFKL